MYIKIKGKRYKFSPNRNLFCVIGVIVLIIVMAVCIRSCTRYNKAIRGAEYEAVLADLPAYQVRPCVAPDGTPTSDYFSIYPPKEGDKVMYLTFDDGPSPKVTPQVLDILKKYNVKATFFVVGKYAEDYPEIIKRIADEGHSIANHTYSHDYEYIYSSTDALLEEINKTKDVVTGIVGENGYSGVFRFPGGAFREERAEFKETLIKEDIVFANWNCLTGDSEVRSPAPSDLIAKAKRSADSAGSDSLVLLMHDAGAKQATADALPAIIEYFQGEGYRFDVIKRR